MTFHTPHEPETSGLPAALASPSIPPEHDIMQMTVDEIIDALNRPWPTSDMPLDQQIQLLIDCIEREKKGILQ